VPCILVVPNLYVLRKNALREYANAFSDWLAYSQMINNLISQAATLERNRVPNDIINNIDPIALVICIPIFDQIVYPFLNRRGILLTLIKKISLGFILASFSMVAAAVVQYYIYKTSRKYPLLSFNTSPLT